MIYQEMDRDLFAAIASFRLNEIKTPEINNLCNICNSPMTNNMNATLICNRCGVIKDDDEETGNMTGQSKLRITGSNSDQFRKDFMRQSIQNTASISSELTKKLLIKFNNEYNQKYNKILIQGDIILKTVDLYHKFIETNKIVLRSRRKLEVLGICLMIIYNQHDRSISVSEISEFMNLDRNSLSEGSKRMRKWASNGYMNDIKTDPITPEILTQLTKMECEDSKGVCLIVSEVLNRIIYVRIENRSILRTKISGIIFMISKRCDRVANVNVKTFCLKIGIKDNTILKFIKDVLIAYHSRFVDIYNKYNLLESPFNIQHYMTK